MLAGNHVQIYKIQGELNAGTQWSSEGKLAGVTGTFLIYIKHVSLELF